MADEDIGAYLTIAGIPGTSEHPKHRNAIEILSFSFSGKQLSGLSIVKKLDSASPRLAAACDSGKNLGSAVLEFFGRIRESNSDSYDTLTGLSSGPTSSSEFFKITMTSVIIASYEMSFEREACLLSYSEVKQIYGTIPAPQTTVQPAHKPLINRLKP
jgi:type VI protein secretion system component Hcp